MKKSKNPDLKTLTEPFDQLLVQLIYDDLKNIRFQQFKSHIVANRKSNSPVYKRN
jgi:hypothetical protein